MAAGANQFPADEGDPNAGLTMRERAATVRPDLVAMLMSPWAVLACDNTASEWMKPGCATSSTMMPMTPEP